MNEQTIEIPAFELVGEIVVPVHFSKPLAELIEIIGFQRVHGEVNQQNFPHNQNRDSFIARFQLAKFAIQSPTYPQVIGGLGCRRLYPATLVEVLAIAQYYPQIFLGHELLAPGSIWINDSGEYKMPSIGNNGNSGKHIHLVDSASSIACVYVAVDG